MNIISNLIPDPSNVEIPRISPPPISVPTAAITTKIIPNVSIQTPKTSQEYLDILNNIQYDVDDTLSNIGITLNSNNLADNLTGLVNKLKVQDTRLQSITSEISNATKILHNLKDYTKYDKNKRKLMDQFNMASDESESSKILYDDIQTFRTNQIILNIEIFVGILLIAQYINLHR